MIGYVGAINALTISPEHRLQVQLEEKLKNVPQLEALQKSVESRDAEIQELKQGFEAMKKTLIKIATDAAAKGVSLRD
ncbi:MAG: hypothetical protein ACREBU_21805 [Nitrososphaera sp.]